METPPIPPVLFVNMVDAICAWMAGDWGDDADVDEEALAKALFKMCYDALKSDPS